MAGAKKTKSSETRSIAVLEGESRRFFRAASGLGSRVAVRAEDVLVGTPARR